ncbi:hypothetical protein FJY63_04075, partial [Candidatus Sumerlaeota bacterium]|nr:hypothetical protein [Candidatus Sumerlaeota bacterium]
MRTRVLVLTAFVMPLVSVGIMLAAAEPTGPPPSPAPPPKPEVTALSVSKKAPTDLGVVVIMLTGADNTQTRLLEDVLGLWLRQQRIGVVSRLRVERLLAEEMVKNRGAAEKSQPTA